MDLTEWIISVALILVVVRQIRGRKLTLIGLLWPVPLVAWGAINYLGGVPAYAADWTFVAVDCAAGMAGAIHFPGDAQLRPDRYTAELARSMQPKRRQVHCVECGLPEHEADAWHCRKCGRALPAGDASD